MRKILNSEQVERYIAIFFICLILFTMSVLLGFLFSLFFIIVGHLLHPVVSLIMSLGMCLSYIYKGIEGLKEQKSLFEIGVGDEFVLAGATIVGLYLTTLAI